MSLDKIIYQVNHSLTNHVMKDLRFFEINHVIFYIMYITSDDSNCKIL